MNNMRIVRCDSTNMWFGLGFTIGYWLREVHLLRYDSVHCQTLIKRDLTDEQWQ